MKKPKISGRVVDVIGGVAKPYVVVKEKKK